MLVAALQHHVRGHIREREGDGISSGEGTARGDKRKSHSPDRAQRKRRQSRSPDLRPPRLQHSKPRNRGSRSRSAEPSDRRGRNGGYSRTPRGRSRSRNRSHSPARDHRNSSPLRNMADKHHDKAHGSKR
jgi:hypothetical protein